MKAPQLAAMYGVDTVTISKWKSMGVRQGIPCPVDDPIAMLDWWQKMIEAGEVSYRPSAKIIAAADRVRAAMPRDDDDDDAEGASESSTDMDNLMARIKSGETSLRYEDGLRISEKNILVIESLLDKAIKDKNYSKISAYRKELTQALDGNRALMKDRGKIQADAGETLPKAEVRSEILSLHQNIQKRFRQEIKGFFPDLEEYGKSREEWNFRVDELVDRICGGLVSSGLGE